MFSQEWSLSFLPLQQPDQALRCQTGQYWTNISGAIISHVANETASFTPAYIVDQDSFNTFLNAFFPEPVLAPVRDLIAQNYDCNSSPYYGDFRMCVAQLIRDSTFTWYVIESFRMPYRGRI